MTPAELLADSLACHRLTRLVTADVITQPLRDRVLAWAWRNRADEVHDALVPSLAGLEEGALQRAMEDGLLGDPPKLATLVTCRWCAGLHMSILVVCIDVCAGRTRWWRLAKRALALSSAAALWATLEER